MGEPRFRTEYEDRHLSAAFAGNEHQLLLLGLADDGPLYNPQSFVGLAGVELAETLFGTGGRLPLAIREALEVAARLGDAVTVTGMRIGDGGTKASLTMSDISAVQAVRLEYDYPGFGGNGWQASVEATGNTITLKLKRGPDGEVIQFMKDALAPTTNAQLAAAINGAELGVTATVLGESDLAAANWTAFNGGTDGALTNAEIAHVLSMLEAAKYPNVLILGAKISGPTGASIRSMLSAHCAESLEDHDQERYAFAECEDFSTNSTYGTQGWLTDVDAWVDSIETAVTGVDDKNLIAFAGSAWFLNGEGERYVAPVAAAAAAAWLGLAIHRSMINRQVPTLGQWDVVPTIPKAYRDRLADARVNFLRYEDEHRGVIIANSRTLAVEGSDYEDAEILRTQYQCGIEARVKGKDVWGTPDDGHGSGLATLKTAMEIPLRAREGKTIVKGEVNPQIDSEGDVVAWMGITHYLTMKTVRHVVFRQR